MICSLQVYLRYDRNTLLLGFKQVAPSHVYMYGLHRARAICAQGACRSAIFDAILAYGTLRHLHHA